MNHPNKPGTHKITQRNDAFFVTTVDDERFPEVKASVRERAKLACRVGYVNGSQPGLLEDFAKALAKTMHRAKLARKVGHRRSRRA